MSVIETAVHEGPARQVVEKVEVSSSLIGPSWDFWLLGGSSLVILPAIFLMPESWAPWVIGFGILMANFINHPHFAHSYQIFYRSFGRRVLDSGMDGQLRARYLVAGFLVPVTLVTYLLYGYSEENLRVLGLAGNLMGFLVGWHYVKQGYGMLIVQSVLKRSFFSDQEKKWLMLNAYALWLFSYLYLNSLGGSSQLWGIRYFVIRVADWMVVLSAGIALYTTMRSGYLLFRKYRENGAKVPVAGLTAYAVTLYVWLFASLNPVVIAIVPALHSLQYLTVVWRFESNLQNDPGSSGRSLAWNAMFGSSPAKRLARFVVLGIALGYLGFWWIPELLRTNSESDFVVQTPGVVLFMFWIFINVHHYFIDNVMWRKENPETSRYLFAALR